MFRGFSGSRRRTEGTCRSPRFVAAPLLFPELGMRAITVGWVGCVLAGAKERPSGIFRLHTHGCKLGACMRSVAVGLVLTLPACTPIVLFSSFFFDFNRLGAGNGWFCHKFCTLLFCFSRSFLGLFCGLFRVDGACRRSPDSSGRANALAVSTVGHDVGQTIIEPCYH